MKNHFIALNAYRGGNKGQVETLPLTEYDKLTAYPWLHDAVLQIRGEQKIVGKGMTAEKLKSQLPFRCAHYYRFIGDKRRQANIDPESFLFQTSVDIDEKELVETALGMARLLNEQEGMWKGMLLHMEYSARKKLHIDIRMPLGLTIEETQRSYCEALGVPCDESCFSPERIIFVTDKASEIYRSADWYAVLPDEELARRREAFLKRGLTIDGRKNNSKTLSYETKQSTLGGTQVPPIPPTAPADSDTATGGDGDHSHLDRGTDGADKALITFDLFRKQANLDGIDINQQGSRHSSLLAILSAGASRVLSQEDLQRAVAIRMPAFAREHDCQQLIRDFYTKYGDSTKPFSRDVMRINAQAEAESQKQKKLLGINGAIASHSNAFTTEDDDDFPPPPDMPKKLPRLVELLTSRTPNIYKAAVACAIFPPLATHLWKTTFRYIDNVDHEATLMCALLAGTGAGKSCVQKPIDLIMEDIRKRDKENLKREKEWKDEVTRKGANKDKRKRPQDLIIQEIDADMTNPAFVMRTAEAQEHFLYTSLNEIDQFDALKGEGKQQFRIMCLAFDPGNQYGQTRVGTQSVTERVCVRFNWNASTTINKGQRYFSKVLTDGPISRINFCTIPERAIGAKVPIYGTYGDDFREQLRPYIENLCRTTGQIDCAEAYQLAIRLSDENAEYSELTQSRIYENFSFRANVIAYLKACVLYVANGCQWEPEIDEFIRWSEQYDLWCKMRFFADAIEKSEMVGSKSTKRGPVNLLQLLPDTFTTQDVEMLRAQYGLSKKGTASMISTWTYRNHIQKCHSHSCHSFIKLKFRHDGAEIVKNE